MINVKRLSAGPAAIQTQGLPVISRALVAAFYSGSSDLAINKV